MPIRINLLAEQQAAEEARRRDPVKRVAMAGGALALVMVFWICSLHLEAGGARAELTRYEGRLLSVEENSKDARANRAAASEMEGRLAQLERYSTNRFYSATLLNALQHIIVDDVRVVHLQTAHRYSTNAEFTFKTNFVFDLAPAASWQFWRSRPPQTNLLTIVTNRVGVITNQVKSLITPAPLATKINMITNKQRVTAQIEIKRPPTATEQITLTIKARDYSNPPGRQVDEFFKAIAAHNYFAQHLHGGNSQGLRLKERAIQPELDQADAISPARPFIPFSIECRYEEIVRSNE
jgi:hypothetical protein